MSDLLEIEIFKVEDFAISYNSDREFFTATLVFRLGDNEYSCNVNVPDGSEYEIGSEPIVVFPPQPSIDGLDFTFFQQTIESFVYGYLLEKLRLERIGRIFGRVTIPKVEVIIDPTKANIRLIHSGGGGW